MTTQPLTELSLRVEAAEAGSRELDGEIARAVGFALWDEPVFNFHVGYDGTTTPVIGDAIPDAPPGQRSGWKLLPEWSTSLDAALALVSEKLPGWKWGVGSSEDRFLANLWTPDDRGYFDATCATPALALIAALLRALQDGTDSHDR